MVEVRIYYYDATQGGFINETININDVKTVSLINHAVYTKKGEFKKFVKQGTISLKNGKWFHNVSYISITQNVIRALKENGIKTEKLKSIEIKYKNFVEKKAINWYYTVKGDKND
jgi:hypothetical protein